MILTLHKVCFDLFLEVTLEKKNRQTGNKNMQTHKQIKQINKNKMQKTENNPKAKNQKHQLQVKNSVDVVLMEEHIHSEK